MKKEVIFPKSWQATRGVYSPAIKVKAGNMELIFVSGQQAEKNENHEVGGSVAEQTENIFQQISEILQAAGSSLKDVVRAQIFLIDIDDFAEFSKVRDKYFAKDPPASTLVAVSAMTRQGARVEIEVTAIKRGVVI
jgi:2-iminobutanoate/2-iminopropanoate deaminase